MAARHHELIYLHRLMVAARHTKKKLYQENKHLKQILKEKLGYKRKNPAVLEGKMPISRKVLAKKVGYKARKWGFFQSHERN